MSQFIIALFAAHHDALAASNDLKVQGYPEDDLRLVNSATNYIRGSSSGGLAEALRGDGLSEADAARFEGWVANGGSLVSARAPFGKAKRAMQILDFHEPDELRSYAQFARDDSDGKPPFSAMFGWPTLSDDFGAVSRMFGLPLLSQNGTPFSSFFHLATLSDAVTPFSRTLGLKLLLRSKTPFSSMLGLPLLAGRGR